MTRVSRSVFMSGAGSHNPRARGMANYCYRAAPTPPDEEAQHDHGDYAAKHSERKQASFPLHDLWANARVLP
jgi:hypothetical protein